MLSHTELKQIAPSVFSNESHEKVSDKYKHISTIQIVDALAKEGYVPVKAMQTRCKLQDKRDFAKHLIRFRHVGSKATLDSGLFPELVLTNSHDGLSSYRLMAGLYRLVCSNGMIAGKTYREVRVRHQGDIIAQVIEGTFEVMESANQLVRGAEEMSQIQLLKSEQQLFANAVHKIYFNEEPTNLASAIAPEDFIRPRRGADKGDDLFTVFNVAQENVIRGGLSGTYRDDKGHYINTSTREVKSIDRNTALNRALWTLTEEMAKLKQAG